MIPLETAKALTLLIEAAARQLNQHIADAAKAGMTVEASLIEVRALALLSRDQLGRDFFARGVPPKVVQIDTLSDLLAAYARIQRQTPEKRPASALDGVSGHIPPAKPTTPLGGLFSGVE